MEESKFIQLLESVLRPDTAAVKRATAELRKTYYPSPAALTLLIQIATIHGDPGLRQLASVEARTLVPRHWNALSSTDKEQIRVKLLHSTLNEQAPLVRHSLARVISAIAKLDLQDGEWLDLPDILVQAARSNLVAQREVGTYILFTLFEVVGDEFASKLSALFALFKNTIHDRESVEVRINTMLALGQLAIHIDSDDDPTSTKKFQAIFPAMVNVLKETIVDGHEDKAMIAFEVFHTLLGSDPQLLALHLQELMQFMIDLGTSRDIHEDSRSQAIAYLTECVKFRRLKVQSMKIGEQLTLISMQLLTELGDSIDDEGTAAPARSALALLDTLAANLPPSQVVVPLLAALSNYANHTDPDYRQAGILALGYCAEGAPDFISTQLSNIFPILFRLLDDPVRRVRQATIHSITRIADELEDELGKEHARLVPALVKNLDASTNQPLTEDDNEKNVLILRASCRALGSIMSGIPSEESVGYLPELLPRLNKLFSHTDFKVRCSAISATSALAASCEDTFLPYFEQTMSSLGEYICIKDSEDELDLRCSVIDAMGSIASAVGTEPFTKYVQPLMQSSEEALYLGHPHLRETTFLFWGTLAQVYQDDFTPFLPKVIKSLLDCLEQEEAGFELELGEEAQELLGEEIVWAGKKIKISSSSGGVALASSKILHETEEDSFSPSTASIEDENWDEYEGVSAVAMEKEIALNVMGDIITHTKKNSLPYMEKTSETLLSLVNHMYAGVRKESIGTLWRTYSCLWGICENETMAKWEPGLPLKIQPTPELVKLGGLVMEATLSVWLTEIERGVVADINQNIAATLHLCGPAVLTHEGALPKITKNLISILQKSHACQNDLGEGQEQSFDAEESSEYDWLVIDSAMDVVISLAHALGPSFGELWKVFQKLVMKYASSNDSGERSTAIGVIAVTIRWMEAGVTPFTSTLMKVILHRLSDEDPDTKANAAYAAGMLCLGSGDSAVTLEAYPIILSKLESLLNTDKPRVIENSVGCVSRMIMAHPGNITIENVLPTLVGFLPLKEDFEENEAVFEMLVRLYGSGNKTVESLTPQLIPIFASALSPPEKQLDELTRGKLIELIKYLHKQEPTLINHNPVLMACISN
ncbi:MAG: hypothetical protein M1829_006053 [Trizodia sp. TS-e1964]|nr:MAG: hypothetical protein M1829_006053 [Trizodia sp. TS-e1964]